MTETSAAASPLPGLRADARRNRDRIVETARDLFTERGPGVPMAAIARRAGIGTATLYRRFPTKESLLAAAYAEQFAECVAVVDDALADPDPWRGFRTMIGEICALQLADHGFSAAFLAGAGTEEPGRHRERAVRGFGELVARAQAAGRLRADFVPADLALAVAATAGLAALFPDDAAEASRRMTAFLIAGFAAGHGGPPLPPTPLTMRDLFDASRRAR
ncbi:TetR/AcrR family transcriptional regulator [Catenuloplanes atrovinosus]|uniref:AcrR family transcriptional regulator n=1 Tax=Catenuloplanes atrovinosus TaxID=137266 RepID=A0AAE3YKD5_9ACTN|nr:helix-turn-helix domain-containing protein [Catenuloplanes atrovinosus]MDR7275389.1 AcrR family transcriptional regulator [Catenuloplanes atrovinosus]